MKMEVSDEKPMPDELREEILARVPAITHLFRLRLVCKSWNTLVQSPSFVRLRLRVASPDPWLVTVRRVNPPNQKFCLCDRSMEKWLQPPLEFLHYLECDFSTSVSAGGLVCCLASEARRGPKSIVVFNPFTKAFKVLPPPPFAGEWWSPVVRVTMSTDQATNAYKVGLCDTRQREVQVYDSKTYSWRAGSNPPRSVGTISRFQGCRNRRKDRLYWYEMEEDKWIEVAMPETSPLLLRYPTIIKGRKGKVLLAAALAIDGGRNGRLLQGFGVWELDRHSQQQHFLEEEEEEEEEAKWVEISRTPQKFWKGLRGALHPLSDWRLVCNQDFICMTGLTRHSISPWNCFYPWLLFYDLARDSWQWSSQPLGEKTWSNYDTICVLGTPSFEAIM